MKNFKNDFLKRSYLLKVYNPITENWNEADSEN